jgi:ABC-2 type transport system permease protein
MHKLKAVIRREFVERVRSRAFLIATILGPAFMAVMIFLPLYLAGRQTAARRIMILDGATGSFGARVDSALSAARFGGEEGAQPRYVVQLIRAADLDPVRDSLIRLIGLARPGEPHPDGLLLLTDEGLRTGTIPYLGSNVGSPADMDALQSTVQTAVLAERLARADLDPDIVRAASSPIRLDKAKITAGRLTGESGEASFFLSYIMTFVLYFALVVYGVQVMNSTLEEKTNRIVEVLASSLTPFQLMLGKILGVGAVGLFQLALWAAAALLLTANLGFILRLVGLPAQAAGAAPLPTISPALLTVFLIFFLLGFFLYAALYAAVGAMCSSHQDTQQANVPVTMAVFAGFMCMFPILNEPEGPLARVLSFVPPVAPFATPLRYSIAPLPWSEVFLSALTTILGVLGVAWLASRVYRIGILAYGKRPSVRELSRWIVRG